MNIDLESREARKALLKLDPRSEKIIRRLYGLDEYTKRTYSEVSKEFGISEKKVIKIEQKSLKKLSKLLK